MLNLLVFIIRVINVYFGSISDENYNFVIFINILKSFAIFENNSKYFIILNKLKCLLLMLCFESR